MARKISARQPNQTVAQPATPQTCASDLRTPAEQTTAAADASVQSALAKAHAQQAAGTPKGRR